IDEEVIGRDVELCNRGPHGLATRLVDIPGVDTLGVHFRDAPGHGVLADALSQHGAKLRGKLFRVVQANDPALVVQDDCGGDHGAEERPASYFVEAGDAQPAALARFTFVAGGAQPPHWGAILAQGRAEGSAQRKSETTGWLVIIRRPAWRATRRGRRA